MTSSRDGFVEVRAPRLSSVFALEKQAEDTDAKAERAQAHGAGMQILMDAELAIEVEFFSCAVVALRRRSDQKISLPPSQKTTTTDGMPYIRCDRTHQHGHRQGGEERARAWARNIDDGAEDVNQGRLALRQFPPRRSLHSPSVYGYGREKEGVEEGVGGDTRIGLFTLRRGRRRFRETSRDDREDSGKYRGGDGVREAGREEEDRGGLRDLGEF